MRATTHSLRLRSLVVVLAWALIQTAGVEWFVDPGRRNRQEPSVAASDSALSLSVSENERSGARFSPDFSESAANRRPQPGISGKPAPPVRNNLGFQGFSSPAQGRDPPLKLPYRS